MPETIVHTAEGVVDGTVTGLAGAVGSVTNEVAHHAETLAAHAAKLDNIEGDTRWIKERLDSLAQTATAVPSEALEELRTELAQLRHEVTEQTAALSEQVTSQTVTEPQTEPPPAKANEAKDPPPTGPLQKLRGALHRLL